MVICGCHFHLSAAIVGMIPMILAGYTIFFWRTRNERIVGYINLLLSVGWFYLQVDSNLKFLFT